MAPLRQALWNKLNEAGIVPALPKDFGYHLWLVFVFKTDLENDLIVSDLAILDIATCRDNLEPVEVTDGFAG